MIVDPASSPSECSDRDTIVSLDARLIETRSMVEPTTTSVGLRQLQVLASSRCGNVLILDERRVFPPVVVSVTQARRWAHQLIADVCPDAVAADVELCVSELTANAVQHTTAPFEVRLLIPQRSPPSSEIGAVRIEVVDGDATVDPWIVTSEPPPPTQASGRGLAVVAALVVSRGTRLEGTQKAVWCVVPNAPQS